MENEDVEQLGLLMRNVAALFPFGCLSSNTRLLWTDNVLAMSLHGPVLKAPLETG